ncbi:armadillo-type protein [Chytridium lagenaria]|nr:armadillo-type protein [Chytridium lagenaria]KAI8851035.1 armadillo-type protein [Chytridium lagenaria]
MSGQADPETLTRLADALSKFASVDGSVRAQVRQYLDAFAQDPNAFSMYLSFVLAKQEVDAPVDVREMAGILLKTNLSNSENRNRISLETWTFCARAALFTVQDPASDPRILKTASIVLPALVAYDPRQAKTVVEGLYGFSQQPHLIEPTLKCFVNICEDIADKLDDELILIIASICIANFEHDGSPRSPAIRALAITAANHIAFHKSVVLRNHNVLPTYVQGLYRRANDSEPEAGGNVLNLADVIPYMLICTGDSNHDIALEACEFWLALFEQEDINYMELLEVHLEKLIQTLLQGMIYTDEEVEELGVDEDTNVADRPEDIQPRFHKAKSHAFESTEEQQKKKDGQAEDEDVDDDDDDDEEDPGVSSWTLRKCSAAALDIMATVFSEYILEHFLHRLKVLLEAGSRTHDNWKELECGCRDHIQSHLPHLVSFMVTNCLRHPHPLVRSITCWTLGRYSSWIVTGYNPNPMNQNPLKKEDHLAQFFYPTLQNILALVIDTNKRVQQAGCSALATIEEVACELLVPSLPAILEHIAHAFRIYQKKNLLILFDAVGTLADSVGLELNNPALIPWLMQPLIQKWDATPDDSRDIFPLFECLSSVAIALGPGFAQFSENVWKRCIQIIGHTLSAAQAYSQNPGGIEEPDMDFVIVSLDLLSGIAQGLKQDVAPLVANTQPPLMDIVHICMQVLVLKVLIFFFLAVPPHEVKQSAYALLGDLASACFENVAPYLDRAMPHILQQIQRRDINDELSLGENIAPFSVAIMQSLVPILSEDDGHDRSRKTTLIENAAITIGRLAFVHSAGVAPHLEQFLMFWCKALRNIPDNLEKESAFLGLCRVAELNPSAVFRYLAFFCDAVVRWDTPSQGLRNQLALTLKNLKEAFARNFPAEVRERLQRTYQIV